MDNTCGRWQAQTTVPTSTVTITIECPDNPDWVAILRGVIALLANPDNFYGSLDDCQDNALAWEDILRTFQ